MLLVFLEEEEAYPGDAGLDYVFKIIKGDRRTSERFSPATPRLPLPPPGHT